MRTDRLIREAVKEAELVSYKWRLGCVLASGPRVLSRGRVRYRHDPAINGGKATWHAEADAIRRLPKGS